jgi:hypothetical protein
MTKKHDHTIDVVSFTGKSAIAMSDAIAGARAELDAWYAQQDTLFFSDGQSIFQASTAAYEAANEFVFIITMFRMSWRSAVVYGGMG